jgi:hypothetical protein
MRDRLQGALDELVAEGAARAAHCLHLPGNAPPWTDSRVRVARGERVTWLAEGRIVLPPGWPGPVHPSWRLWHRITPGGRAHKAGRDTHTFEAARDGALEFGLLLGEWKTPEGELAAPAETWSEVEGAIDAAVIHWGEAAPAVGLERLVALSGGDALVREERARLADPRTRAPGWSPHWLLGESDSFFLESCDGRPCMAAHPRDDASIIRYEIDSPVGPDTALLWRWRVDELPSRLPEDQLFQHDYLSIAAEFDCGRDLTWYWSHSLPVETWYPCPIPDWTPRETHFVVRSGEEGLGEWHRERRLLAPDYRTALGGEPGRLVAVWLIAVSLFQHGEGRAWFSEIAIEHEGRRIEIPTA